MEHFARFSFCYAGYDGFHDGIRSSYMGVIDAHVCVDKQYHVISWELQTGSQANTKLLVCWQ